MSTKDQDERLDRLLRELPRERAPDAFTRRVLSEARGRPAGAGFRLPAWGVAVAAALLVAVPAGIWIYNTSQRAALAAEIGALRAQHERLTGELRALRQQMSTTQPVIYLGGDDRADYVLDLKRLVREQLKGMPPPPPSTQPARLPVSFTGGAI
jgi:anti-sigma factor RsiW